MLSLIMSLKVRVSFPRKLSFNWVAAISLAALFFIGYILSLLLMLIDVRFPFELVTGSLFLGSACFIYIVFRLALSANSSLEHKISQHNRTRGKLKTLSFTDELTGLYNRQGFFMLMDHHVKLARRQKKRIVLFYADIDNLKGINDTLGHQEGDLILVDVANVLKESFRKSDIIARVGGDEFLVFLIGADEDYVELINKNFRESLEIYNAKRHQKYKLSISTGVTHYDPEYNDSMGNMLDQAYELINKQKMQQKNPEIVEW